MDEDDLTVDIITKVKIHKEANGIRFTYNHDEEPISIVLPDFDYFKEFITLVEGAKRIYKRVAHQANRAAFDEYVATNLLVACGIHACLCRMFGKDNVPKSVNVIAEKSVPLVYPLFLHPELCRDLMMRNGFESLAEKVFNMQT